MIIIILKLTSLKADKEEKLFLYLEETNK